MVWQDSHFLRQTKSRISLGISSKFPSSFEIKIFNLKDLYLSKNNFSAIPQSKTCQAISTIPAPRQEAENLRHALFQFSYHFFRICINNHKIPRFFRFLIFQDFPGPVLNVQLYVSMEWHRTISNNCISCLISAWFKCLVGI